MPTIVHVLISAYLLSMMFSMGLSLGGEVEDRPSKHRRRRLLVRALVFNLVLLPAIALLLVNVLHPSQDGRIAILLLAACPGGRFAPHLCRMARGELALSVEITLFLAKLTVLTAPLMARWTLHLTQVEIHELPLIARLLVLQLLPFVVGKQLRRRLGARVAPLARPLELASWLCALVIVVLLLHAREMRIVTLLSAGDWLVVLIFATLSLGLAWLLGGRSGPVRRTFAISANARDLALALVVVDAALPEHRLRLTICGAWLLFFLFDLGFARWSHRHAPTPEPTALGHEVPTPA